MAATTDDNDGHNGTGNSGGNQRRTLTDDEVVWDLGSPRGMDRHRDRAQRHRRARSRGRHACLERAGEQEDRRGGAAVRRSRCFFGEGS